MSLSGMHIVCSSVYAATVGPATSPSADGSLPYIIQFAKTQSAAGSAGKVPGTGGVYLVRAHTSIQGFVAVSTVSAEDAIAAAQDANRNRWIIEADAHDHDYYVASGNFVAWAPA